MTRVLNDKERLFCREYLIDLNPRSAAIRAGLRKFEGLKMIEDEAILEHIDRFMLERERRVEVNADKVLQEIAKSAFLDPIDLYDSHGNLLPLHEMPEHARRAIASIEVDADGRQKVKFLPKDQMLVALGRHLRLFVDRVEVESNVGLGDRLSKALEKSRSALVARELKKDGAEAKK